MDSFKRKKGYFVFNAVLDRKTVDQNSRYYCHNSMTYSESHGSINSMCCHQLWLSKSKVELCQI